MVRATPFLIMMLTSTAYLHITHAANCADSSSIKVSLHTFRDGSGSWNSVSTQFSGESLGVSKTEGILDSDHWRTEVDHKTGKGHESFSTTLSVPPPRATPGYELFDGIGYYKFHEEAKTWMEAKKVCEQEGAHLAIINSESESTALKELFNRHRVLPLVEFDNAVSIGFHDRYIEGQYLTIYDEPLSSTGFTRWSIVQPDDGKLLGPNSVEDCGSMQRDGLLNDVGCYVKIAFICEQEL